MDRIDPHIWAVGDAVEAKNRVTGKCELIPLAGPAHRQGRTAADVICGRDARFSDVQATAVCGFFGLTAALTGATEKTLRRVGMEDFKAIYLHPNHHAGYYPGAKPIHLKLLFRASDGLLLHSDIQSAHNWNGPRNCAPARPCGPEASSRVSPVRHGESL